MRYTTARVFVLVKFALKTQVMRTVFSTRIPNSQSLLVTDNALNILSNVAKENQRLVESWTRDQEIADGCGVAVSLSKTLYLNCLTLVQPWKTSPH